MNLGIQAKTFIATGMLTSVLASSVAFAAGPLCFEAEHALTVTPPMVAGSATNRALQGTPLDPKGASESAFLEVTQGSGNPPKVTGGEATYEFTLKESGTYFLWCRVWWLDECGNSLTMTLNDGRPFTFGNDAVYKSWHWVKAPRRVPDLRMEAGTQKLMIQNREDGVRIDQVLITKDRRFVPVGVEQSQKPAGG